MAESLNKKRRRLVDIIPVSAWEARYDQEYRRWELGVVAPLKEELHQAHKVFMMALIAYAEEVFFLTHALNNPKCATPPVKAVLSRSDAG